MWAYGDWRYCSIAGNGPNSIKDRRSSKNSPAAGKLYNLALLLESSSINPIEDCKPLKFACGRHYLQFVILEKWPIPYRRSSKIAMQNV